MQSRKVVFGPRNVCPTERLQHTSKRLGREHSKRVIVHFLHLDRLAINHPHGRHHDRIACVIIHLRVVIPEQDVIYCERMSIRPSYPFTNLENRDTTFIFVVVALGEVVFDRGGKRPVVAHQPFCQRLVHTCRLNDVPGQRAPNCPAVSSDLFHRHHDKRILG